MDVLVLKDIVVGVAAVLGAALAIWTFFQSPSKKNADDLANFKRDEHEPLKGRVSAVETRVANVPSKDTVHQLDKKVTELNGTINVVAESLKAVERTAHRIENFLLDQAKK
jgi:hypothetical protein